MTVLSMELSWKGPLALGEPDRWSDAHIPPSLPGLYLWAANGSKGWTVTYVGQSSNLKKRTYDHIVMLLGGGYELYEGEALRDGFADVVHVPALADLNREFLSEKGVMQRVTYQNLACQGVFWAVLDADPKVRQAVESGLIAHLQEEYRSDREMVINRVRISSAQESAVPVSVVSKLPHGVSVLGFPSRIAYGSESRGRAHVG